MKTPCSVTCCPFNAVRYRWFLSLLFVWGLFLCGIAHGLEASVKIPGLVSWWRGEENALDAVGSASAQTSSATYAPGKSGQAFGFDGLGQRIEFGDPESLRFTAEFSFDFWAFVNAPTPVGAGGVILFRGDARPGMDPYALGVSAPLKLEFRTADIDGNASGISADVPLQRWFHVVAVFNHGVMDLFIDGEPVAHGVGMPIPFPDLQTGGGFSLGNTTATHNFPFNGQLDEVAAWSHALTAEEAKRLFLLGGRKECPADIDRSQLSPEEHARFIAAGCLREPIHGAKGTPQVVNGFVVGVDLSDRGYGYTNVPLVKIVGGSGVGATARAVIRDGIVVAIEIENPGKGYATPPTVKIASPSKPPELGIRVTRVAVDLRLILGERYQLFSSHDLANWTPVGSEFVAEDETLTREFEPAATGQYFKVFVLP